MILIAITLYRNEGKFGSGQCPWKVFGTTTFQSKENALFDIERALQKRHFRSFADKDKDPLVARLEYVI